MSFIASIVSQLLYFLALRFYDPVLGQKSPGFATYHKLLVMSNAIQDKYVKPQWEYRKAKQARKTFIAVVMNNRSTQDER